MHIISKKPLREFWGKYPDSEKPLQAWYRTVERSTYKNWSQLHDAFSTADKVEKWIVFNIGGNKYRLVIAVNYPYRMCYVRFVGTHQVYDRIDVATV